MRKGKLLKTICDFLVSLDQYNEHIEAEYLNDVEKYYVDTLDRKFLVKYLADVN